MLPTEDVSPLSIVQPELDTRPISVRKSAGLYINTQSVSDDWELVDADSITQSRSWPAASPIIPYVPDSPTYTPSPVTAHFDEPEAIILYKQRPLPSLPATSKRKRGSSAPLKRPDRGNLKLICPRGDEFQTKLASLGRGPSPIETFANDDQSHERIAIGLERDPGYNTEQALTMCLRKSADDTREWPCRTVAGGFHEDEMKNKEYSASSLDIKMPALPIDKPNSDVCDIEQY